MTGNVKVSYQQILLSDIRLCPHLTPEVLDIKSHLEPDRTRITQYEELFLAHGQVEPIKVWKAGDGTFSVIDSVEGYLAAKAVSSDANLNALIFETATFSDAKDLATQFSTLRGSQEGHLSRCLNMRTLVECGCTYSDLRRIYCVKKSKSPEGKRLERDYKLISNNRIFARVLGVEALADVAKGESTVLKDVLKPKPSSATLAYATALDLIRILRDDRECVKLFDEEYQKYLDSLRAGYMYPDEITKPVFKWTNYNRRRVREIALAASRKGIATDYNFALQFGDPELEDQSWSVTYNEKTHEYVLPRISVNLANKADSNLRKLIDLRYRMEQMQHSLDSYIKRLRPAKHGSRVRVHKDSVSPYLETRCNVPRIEDHSYFDYIRKHKVLHYCNRQQLLRSIGLRAIDFGFNTYSYKETSTHRRARESFFSWFDREYLKRIAPNHGGEGLHCLPLLPAVAILGLPRRDAAFSLG